MWGDEAVPERREKTTNKRNYMSFLRALCPSAIGQTLLMEQQRRKRAGPGRGKKCQDAPLVGYVTRQRHPRHQRVRAVVRGLEEILGKK